MLRHEINHKVVSRISSRIPIRLLEKLVPIPFIVPYYHIVSDEKVIHVCNLYPYKGTREFTEDLDYLLKHFEPISLDDLLQALARAEEFPRRSLHLTFDDGFRELHDVVAPILIRKGVPATFFVNSAFTDNRILNYQHKASILAERVKEGLPGGVLQTLRETMKREGFGGEDILPSILSVPYDKREALDEMSSCMGMDLDGYLSEHNPYLDSTQIRRLLGKGFTIGSHSIDHPLYANIPFEEQVRQTVESTRWVRERYGLRYGAFAFPHNDRNVADGFFREIHASGLVDISFGTGGIYNPGLSRHLQRFSLEKPVIPAERIIAIEFARKLWKG